MGKWEVTEQAVDAMKDMSTQLQELADRIHQETQQLKSSYDENKDGLGAHSSEIQSLLNEIEKTEQDASIPVKKLVLKLIKAATIRKNHIENNLIKNSSNSIRNKAVSDAWKREKNLVLQGKGTRNWTVGQQIELIKTGKVSGFEGQHMLSAKDYPHFASDEKNIQFLTYEEHFYGAHNGDFKNSTNGRYEPSSGKFIQTKNGKTPEIPIIDLTNKCDPDQIKELAALNPEFGYSRKSSYQESKERNRGKKSRGSFTKDE